MKFNQWMIGVLFAALSAAVVWGGIRNTVSNHETRLGSLEVFKDKAIEKLSTLDAKIDLLLGAQGLEYKDKKK